VTPSARLLVAVLAVVATLAATGPAAAQQQECPKRAFVEYDGLVYAGEQIPASVTLAPGEALGNGTLDRPTDETGCKRERVEAQVVRLGDLDPKVAVGVAGEAGTAFVLGARCAGFSGNEYWDCLLAPLAFRGIGYTGTRYPAEPAPQGALELGDPLGEATLGDETVTVRAIEGVDPALAVAIEGRSSEAYLAPGVCPYEGLANDEAQNDLLRCLRGPVWLAFDPPGARVGESVTARADRSPGPELSGATVELVRLRQAADALPQDLSGAVSIGSLTPSADGRVTLQFAIPELEQGVYEAVVTCPECGEQYGGQTSFPGGSLLVLEARKSGSSSAQIVLLVVGALAIVLIFAAVIAWRRGWHRGRPGPGPDEQ
jgi:hypothetical protein